MKKKSIIIAFVVGLVMTSAIPALTFTIDNAKGEKMYIGGLFLTDIGYWHRSKEVTGVSDQTQFFLSVPFVSRIQGSMEIGNVGGYWEIGVGGDVLNPAGGPANTTLSGSPIAGTNNFTNYIETRKLYGWYAFGNCKILAGKNDGRVFTLTTNQWFGINKNAHQFGLGYGGLYEGRDPEVRFSQSISKQVGYQISLSQSPVYVDQGRTSYSALPMLSAKVLLNLGVIGLYPAAVYTTVKWDQLPKGYDDSLTAWAVLMPVKVNAGLFEGKFQLAYGQNIYNLFWYLSSFQQYGRDNGAIKNTTAMNGFGDLAYTFGPVTPHIFFGFDRATNSDLYKAGEDNNTRTFVGANLVYKVAPGMNLVPEFTFYDRGKRPGDATKPDLGNEWLGGVQFQFFF